MGDIFSKEYYNHHAYMDVFECNGPSFPDNLTYMNCYRFWYPLGHEFREDEKWVYNNED